MEEFALELPASEVSAELLRRGIAADTPVRVTVPILLRAPTGAAIAEAGGAFDWLADEPDLYSDADIISLGT